jgi:hypothetical protein
MCEQAHAVAVVLKRTDMLIGHMEFHPWFAPQTYEIGWVFNRAYHGQGYATEAAHELLRYGFEAFGLHRIIVPVNPRTSLRVGSWKSWACDDVARFVWEEQLHCGKRPSWPVLLERWKERYPGDDAFKDWRVFRTCFKRGEEATPPRYPQSNDYIASEAREYLEVEARRLRQRLQHLSE